MQLNAGISPKLVEQRVPAPAGWADRLKTRWRARLRGRLVEIRVISEVAGLLMWLRYLMPRGSIESRLSALLLAFRRTRSPLMLDALQRSVHPWLVGRSASEIRTRRVGWSPYEYVRADAELPTSLVLKEPRSGGEKGVLYVSFEYNWMRLLAHHDAKRLLAEYFLVGASSWSPTDFAVFGNFAGLSDDPVFMGISNYADVPVYRAFRPVVEPVPILASDWINPAYYDPKPPAGRDIDILMVANWLTFKRHWLLFEALRKMRRTLRVVLVGMGTRLRTEQAVRAEARAFGAPQDIELVTNANIETVSAFQCSAKISVLFSRREGSCVATAESLFAGAPVAMCRKAHVGSKAYINDQTGVLLDERRIAHGLSAFLERRQEFRPREWAMANITCHQSSAKLNALLRDYSLRTGRPWTADITPLCWRYVPSYLDAPTELAMRPAVERLRAEHGITLKKFVYRPPS